VAQPRRFFALGRRSADRLRAGDALQHRLRPDAAGAGHRALDGFTRGFAPYEKTVLAALWIVPLVARSFPQATLIPLAVPVMLQAFALLLRRAMHETGAIQASGVLRRVP